MKYIKLFEGFKRHRASNLGSLEKNESSGIVPTLTPNLTMGSVTRVIKGEYFPPRGDYDAMHSFQSRRRDGFGGKMNTLVMEGLKKFYTELGLNPEIVSIKIKMDDATPSPSPWKVSWEVTIGESKDGKAWVGLTSRGGAGHKDGPGGSVQRAENQAVKKISSLAAEVGDMGLESKRILDFTFQGKRAFIRQIFIAYTNPSKFPPIKKGQLGPRGFVV